MAVTLLNLAQAQCDGKPKTNGIAKAYWIPYCDVETHGTIADHTTANINDIGKVTSAHTLKLGKAFLEIPLQLHKNSYKSSFQGESGSGNHKTSFSGMIPGFSDLTTGTINYMVRTPGLCLVEMPNGDMFQIGDNKIPAFTKCESDTETTDSDSATGKMLTIEAVSDHEHIYDSSLSFDKVA